MDLLGNAGIRQRDHLEGIVVIKVCGRIVEGNVAVFTDADETQIHGPLCQQFGQLPDGFCGVCLTVDQVVFAGMDHIHEPLPEILLEAGGMLGRDAHIFVQMEHFHLAPVDILFYKMLEERKLGRAGGQQQPGRTVPGNGLVENRSSMSGCSQTHFVAGCKHVNFHIHSPPDRCWSVDKFHS